MPLPSPLHRRAFLLAASRRRRVVELSCERLYMRYVDARSEGRTEEFLLALERHLAMAGEIRLTAREWLARDDFRADVGWLLREPRAGRHHQS